MILHIITWLFQAGSHLPTVRQGALASSQAQKIEPAQTARKLWRLSRHRQLTCRQLTAGQPAAGQELGSQQQGRQCRQKLGCKKGGSSQSRSLQSDRCFFCLSQSRALQSDQIGGFQWNFEQCIAVRPSSCELDSWHCLWQWLYKNVLCVECFMCIYKQDSGSRAAELQ